MTRKLSKEEIKDKFDGEELDLSLCNLAKVPVREMVSSFGFRSKINSSTSKRTKRRAQICHEAKASQELFINWNKRIDFAVNPVPQEFYWRLP